MKQLLLLVLPAILLSCSTQKNSSSNNEEQNRKCCKANSAHHPFDSAGIKQLSKDYKHLKHKRCQGCQYFGSDLHLVMQALGTKLSGKSEAFIEKNMGAPDTKRNNQWIYYWRGEHDYLYFVPNNGTMTSAWYMAYE